MASAPSGSTCPVGRSCPVSTSAGLRGAILQDKVPAVIGPKRFLVCAVAAVIAATTADVVVGDAPLFLVPLWFSAAVAALPVWRLVHLAHRRGQLRQTTPA